MLTGQAKTDYQREYMRRRRAGLDKPPKADPLPTPRQIDKAKDLINSRGSCPSWAYRAKMLDGAGVRLWTDDERYKKAADRSTPETIALVAARIREHKRSLRAKAKERR